MKGSVIFFYMLIMSVLLIIVSALPSSKLGCVSGTVGYCLGGFGLLFCVTVAIGAYSEGKARESEGGKVDK